MTQASTLATAPPARADRFPRLRRAGDILSNVSTQLGAVALLCIVLICGVNVVGRYVFSHAFSWAEEAMIYLMVFVIFSSSAAVTWRGVHMHLDMLVKRLPAQLRAAVATFITFFSVTLLLVLAWNSFFVVSKLFRFNQRSDALELPMWIPQSFLMVGVILIAVMMVLRLVVFGPLAVDDAHSELEPSS
ncbi:MULTISPECIES: TRAP transporter small permease [unclassified Xanthobacter]|uniref:TRAP transporter small permease n=1 Tax=unclassified Xanthobacter TaxID=2623496 RepID=UPI001EDE1EA7|nr:MULTISPECIES: TRAP transporter small permease [unclassified Xanthobacter]